MNSHYSSRQGGAKKMQPRLLKEISPNHKPLQSLPFKVSDPVWYLPMELVRFVLQCLPLVAAVLCPVNLKSHKNGLVSIFANELCA